VPVEQTFSQPRLAHALARLTQPEGTEWFQTGEFAEHFVEAVQATGGKFTMDDLAAYEPRWDEPLAFRAFGDDMLGSPPLEYGPAYAAGLGVLEAAALKRGRIGEATPELSC
jgi:gamma-glutamyltranspeptidase/glutathione hydrolase